MPAQAHLSWRSTLATEPGRTARVLAWAAPADGELVVLSPAALSLLRHDTWVHRGWHEIERGGWNAETAQLRWQVYSGEREAVRLPDPARVPEVFAERVAASIVFERFVPVDAHPSRGVIVSGRRDLADGGARLSWHASLTRGLTWRTPGLRELADEALAEVREQYDPR